MASHKTAVSKLNAPPVRLVADSLSSQEDQTAFQFGVPFYVVFLFFLMQTHRAQSVGTPGAGFCIGPMTEYGQAGGKRNLCWSHRIQHSGPNPGLLAQEEEQVKMIPAATKLSLVF